MISWLAIILYGFLSGLTEFLPISSQAHQTIASILLGLDDPAPLRELLIHVSILAALLVCCSREMGKLRRENRLTKLPVRRRTRPVDTKSMMTMRLLKVAGIPLLIGMLLYGRAAVLAGSMSLLALLISLNGIVLFVPQLVKSGNKDSRSMSPLDGVLIGLAGALGAVPGFSGIGAMLSVASVRGVDRNYALQFVLLLLIPAMVVILIFDAIALSAGMEAISAPVLIRYLLTMVSAYLGSICAISTMRSLAVRGGISGFSYYCWGTALFSLILYLTT